MNRTRTPLLMLALLLMPLTVLAAPAKKKTKKQTTQAQLSAILDGRRDDVLGCAQRLAGTAVSFQVQTHLTLNKDGQLISHRVEVTAPGADVPAIKACIDGVLKSIKFPRSDAPLITIDRSWEMKLQ